MTSHLFDLGNAKTTGDDEDLNLNEEMMAGGSEEWPGGKMS